MFVYTADFREANLIYFFVVHVFELPANHMYAVLE